MEEIDVLRDLFDEKVVGVVNVFLEHPERNFSLSQVSKLSKVHIATVFRILNKLNEKDFVRVILVGKSKSYQLKRGEKTFVLFRFLKREGDYLSDFIEKVKLHPRIKKIILEAKSKKGAKILIVGNFLPSQKLKSITNEIRRKHNFKINFVEISEKQFGEMETLGLYDLKRKVIWERRED